MKVELTDRYLRGLQSPTSGRIEVSDAKRPGLRIRLSASGRASWVYEKRVKGGPKRKHGLGTWPAVSLSEARKIALEIESEASRGVDRVALAEEQRLADEIAKAAQITVGEAVDSYAALHLCGLRSGEERERQLRQSLKSKMELPTQELKSAHLQAVIDGHVQRGRATMANRVRSALRAFTAWGFQRGYFHEDIGQRVSKASREVARERVPSLSEVQAIYRACEKMGALWGPLFQLIILTGQRRSEIVSLTWSEIDLDGRRLIKPGSQTKNGKPHITHLSEAALGIIQAVGSGNDGWVFTTTGQTPVSGISRAKKRLDKLVADSVEPWRIHDLRSSMATALAEAGEPENVVDRILNHSAVGSAPSAVARIYNQSELLPQRARALDRWSQMVTQGDAEVVQIYRGSMS